MFLVSFLNTEESPCIVWNKSWGSITPEIYYERSLPFIRYEIDFKSNLIFMEHNAPRHKSTGTLREFDRLRINNIF